MRVHATTEENETTWVKVGRFANRERLVSKKKKEKRKEKKICMYSSFVVRSVPVKGRVEALTSGSARSCNDCCSQRETKARIVSTDLIQQLMM